MWFMSFGLYAQNDISLSQLNAPDDLARGSKIKVRVLVTNLGNQTAPGTNLIINLLDNSAIGSGTYRQELARFGVGSLNVGFEKEFVYEITVPANLPIKRFRLEASVGSETAYTDVNKENNYKFKDVYVVESSVANACAEPKKFELIGGQQILTGFVNVYNDKTNLYVTYTTRSPWTLQETHLYVGTLAGLPRNNSGTPIPGQFPYKNAAHVAGTTNVTYTIPLSSLPECYIVAAHASVSNGASSETAWSNSDSDVEFVDGSKETAWTNGTSFGTAFGSNRWGGYSEYCTQACIETPVDPITGIGVTCENIKISQKNGIITIKNYNDAQVFVAYQVFVNNLLQKTANVKIDANSEFALVDQLVENTKIVFLMGGDNIPGIIKGDICVLQDGVKTTVIGTRQEQYEIYQDKIYDARDWFWFVRVERKRLSDRYGKTVQDTDKGVSLNDLTTIANETNLKVSSTVGQVGFTHTLGWFILDAAGNPSNAQILFRKLGKGGAATTQIPTSIPAGTRIGFFLVGDNEPNHVLANSTAQVRFSGKELQYSLDGFNWKKVPNHVTHTVKSLNKDGKEMAIGGIDTVDGQKVLRVGFEDQYNGDYDYEDHVVTIFMQGVTQLQTKIVTEVRQVPNYVQVPCGDCTQTLEYVKPVAKVACDLIVIDQNEAGAITIANNNNFEALVAYTISENGTNTKTGKIYVSAGQTVNFTEPVPATSQVKFSMGASSFENTFTQGDRCFVKDGKITIEAGEREEIYEIFEGKVYDARSWEWFLPKERVVLKDRLGKTVTESEKGVSLKDLTTLAEENNVKVDLEVGAVASTHGIGWFKIVNGMPTEPKLLVHDQRAFTKATTAIANIPANTSIGFFLVAAIYNNNEIAKNPNAIVRFVGTTLEFSKDNGLTWKALPQSQVITTIKEWNLNAREMAIGGITTQDGKEAIRVGFENNTTPQSDWDYEDVYITFHMSGVTHLKTKIVKITQEVDKIVEAPCGNCEAVIESKTPVTCLPKYVTTSYKLGDLQHRVTADRKNPLNAEIADLSRRPTKFVTLGGKGGEIVMDFQAPIAILAGKTDLRIAEVSFDKTIADSASYPELAEVWVSQNGVDYKQAGTAKVIRTDLDLDGTGWKWFRYVKLKDITESIYGGDGFDLNYMECLNGTYDVCTVGIPANLRVTDVKPCCVYFAWDAVAGASSYKIAYMDAGSARWKYVTTTNTHFAIQGLPGTDYTIKVGALCEDSESEYSLPITEKSLGEPACDMPTNPVVSQITLNSARITVTAARNALGGYEILYRKANGTGELFQLRSATTTFDLVGLESDAIYEYQVKTLCSVDGKLYSAWTTPKTFRTCPQATPVCGDCPVPTYMTITEIGENTALVKWNKAANIDEYEVYYRTVGASRWITKLVSTNEISLEGLLAGMTYDVYVRTRCTTTRVSLWTTGKFKTLGNPECRVPKDVQVIDRIKDIEGVPSTVTTVSWSGDDTGAMHYEVMYQVKGVNSTRKYLVATSNQIDIEGLVPGYYEFWVRSICPGNGNSGWAYKWQQVGVFACAIPDCKLFSFNIVSPSEVKANWAETIGALSYEIMYQVQGTQVWTVLKSATKDITLTNLYPGMKYSFRVRSICESPITSDWSCIATFETQGTSVCPIPKDIEFTSLLPFCMTAVWDESYGGAIEYEVQYRTLPSGAWQTRYVSKNMITFTELVADQKYEFRVRAICVKNAANQIVVASGYASAQFTALGYQDSGVLTRGRTEDNNGLLEAGELRAYPNPFAENLNIKLRFEQDVTITMYDVVGATISTKIVKAGEQDVDFDGANLRNGMYLLRIVSEDGSINKAVKVIRSK